MPTTLTGTPIVLKPSTHTENYETDVTIFYKAQESVAPPVAFVSVSGLTILGSALSAYKPPKGILFNELATYKLFPFPSNLVGSLTAMTFTVSVPGYLEGSFNRVTTAGGTEVSSTSAAYFAW